MGFAFYSVQGIETSRTIVLLTSKQLQPFRCSVTAVDEYIHALLNRRLDDRIREICEKASTTDPDDREIAVIKQELLCLMHQKINRMRRVAVTELDESLVEWHRA